MHGAQPTCHAARLARFAVEAVAAAAGTLVDEDDPAQGCVRIRVGLSSGPVRLACVRVCVCVCARACARARAGAHVSESAQAQSIGH